jgi:hypothetical protein
MPGVILRSTIGLVGLLCALVCPRPALAAPAPPAFKLGECQDTHVEAIRTPVPLDRQVLLTNGLTLHYDQETYSLYALKLGQPVRICLVNIGTFCGLHKINTRTYLLHNPYTRRKQMLPDTASLCVKAR